MGAPGINGQHGDGGGSEGRFSLLFHPFLASLTNLAADMRVGRKLGPTLKNCFLGGKSTCSGGNAGYF